MFKEPVKNLFIRDDNNADGIPRIQFVGISGFARSGKTTMANAMVALFGLRWNASLVLPLSDTLKAKIDPFLRDSCGISAWTEDEREKKLVRPLFVAYGTHLMRSIDEDYWIKELAKKAKDYLVNNFIVIIPDVRYQNEWNFIKKNGAIHIYVEKTGVFAPNSEEQNNDSFLRDNADIIFVNENQEDFSENEFLLRNMERIKIICDNVRRNN